jgi:anti-sigma factor RsiW
MGSTKHPTDWERQREQLSAYLDGELSAAERAEIARHLPTCAECRGELAGLRRVRTLLGALPAPALPRSFTLPASGAAISRTPVAPSRPTWYRASQWAGSLAASIGLFLLLGNALLGALGASPAGTATGAKQSPAFDSAQATQTTARARQSPDVGSNPGVTNTPTADQAQATPTPRPSSPPPDTHSGEEPPIVPLTGAGLLIGGVALLVIGRVARRRRSAP